MGQRLNLIPESLCNVFIKYLQRMNLFSTVQYKCSESHLMVRALEGRMARLQNGRN